MTRLVNSGATLTTYMYDIRGRGVAVLVIERRDAGVYEVQFEATGFPSGVYVYRMQVTEKPLIGPKLREFGPEQIPLPRSADVHFRRPQRIRSLRQNHEGRVPT